MKNISFLLCIVILLPRGVLLAQDLRITTRDEYSIRSGKKVKVGIIYKNKSGNTFKTKGILKGSVPWRHYEITSDYCKVKKGRLKLRKKEIDECGIPITIYHKKDNYTQEVVFQRLYNGNQVFDYEMKESAKESFLKALLKLPFYSISRSGFSGNEGSDAPNLVGRLELINQCDQEMLQLSIHYKEKEHKYIINPKYLSLIHI